jgi:hypothetical protein
MDRLKALFSDPKTALYMYQIIEDLVDSKIAKANFDRSYPGIVSAVSGNYADVKLMGSTTATPNIENTTGKTLTVGDSVEVLAIRNSLNNLVIHKKKEVI